MKKIIALVLLLVIAVGQISAAGSMNKHESLNYKVMYKWGLVNKQAGHVNLSTYPGSNGHFKSVLAAASEKWADKIYRVRDTLIGSISSATLEPAYYEKISHEGGEYKHDVIRYRRSTDLVTATCERSRRKKNSDKLSTTEISLEATGFTVDMLSSFYYMRSLDYPSMKPGEAVEMNIFSGKRKELLTITYRGTETITIDGENHQCYAISFKFTGKGGKQTSDSMYAWIGTDTDRIPLKLEGKLPVGKVQCFFTGRGK